MFPNNLLHSGASSTVAALALIVALGPAPAEAKTKLTTSVSLQEAFDDNVLNTSANEKNSFVTRIQPQLTFKRDSDLSEGLLEFGGTGRIYHSYSELNAVDTWARYDYTRRLSNRLVFSTDARYDNYPKREEVLEDTELLVSGRPDFESFNASAALQYQYSQLLLYTLTAGGRTRNYGSNRTLGATPQQSIRDSLTRFAQFQAQRTLSRIDTVRAIVAYNDSNLEDAGAGENDATIWSYTAGWNRRWTDNWQTDASLGFRQLKNEFRSGTSNQNGVIGGLTVSRILRNGSASLSYNRETQGSSGGNSSVDVDTYSLLWRHQLSAKLSMNANASYQNYQSPAETQNPDLRFFTPPATCLDGTFTVIPCTVDNEVDRDSTRATLRFDYRLRRHMSTSLAVRWTDLSSSGRFGVDYNKLLTMLGFRYHFDTDL